MILLLRRLLYILRGSRHDADLREEIEAHRALRQDAFERAGFAPEDAALASRRVFGNVALAVDDAREVWTIRTLDSVSQHVRAALRGLRKSPGATPWTPPTSAAGFSTCLASRRYTAA